MNSRGKKPTPCRVMARAHNDIDAQQEAVVAKKKRKPTAESAVKRDLHTAKYRMKVVEDKTKYRRKRDKPVRMEDCPKAA